MYPKDTSRVEHCAHGVLTEIFFWGVLEIPLLNVVALSQSWLWLSKKDMMQCIRMPVHRSCNTHSNADKATNWSSNYQNGILHFLLGAVRIQPPTVHCIVVECAFAVLLWMMYQLSDSILTTSWEDWTMVMIIMCGSVGQCYNRYVSWGCPCHY